MDRYAERRQEHDDIWTMGLENQRYNAHMAAKAAKRAAKQTANRSDRASLALSALSILMVAGTLVACILSGR